MGRHARWATIASDESLDVVAAARRLLAHTRAVLAEERITVPEASALVDLAEIVLREARESSAATDMADVAQLAALSYLTPQPMNAHLRKRLTEATLRCREAGLLPHNVLLFPVPDEPTAS